MEGGMAFAIGDAELEKGPRLICIRSPLSDCVPDTCKLQRAPECTRPLYSRVEKFDRSTSFSGSSEGLERGNI